MTGNCTRECTEFGHSDTCWMPGQPSPNRKSRGAPKLSTFVPYQEREVPERPGGGSPKLVEERAAKVANIRFVPPYSAYSSASGHEPGPDCPLEEIPLGQAATTPSSQGSKREIYLGSLTMRMPHFLKRKSRPRVTGKEYEQGIGCSQMSTS
ncbi:protocadherin-1 isoform X1 [Arapaima gigas]